MMVDPNWQADVVVVGAGSAGAVLAARLSENPKLQVMLIEAGKPSWYPWLSIPIGYFKTVGHPKFDWGFQTDPEPEMADRRLPWPRGKGLGGSSLINGMLYLRGHRKDYEQWSAMGNEGWSWNEVLPYFQRAMHAEHPKGDADGQGGPLWISDLPTDPLSDAFVEAAGACGIARTSDFNQGENQGAGYFRMNTHKGVRMSTSKAYLQPARHRPNLRVVSGARAAAKRHCRPLGGRAGGQCRHPCSAGLDRGACVALRDGAASRQPRQPHPLLHAAGGIRPRAFSFPRRRRCAVQHPALRVRGACHHQPGT